jgi:ABC-type oligopeptide transport system substrate-binding subunit
MIRQAFLLAGISLLLWGCGDNINNEKLRVDIIDDYPHTFAIGNWPLDDASAYLRSSTARGLVAFDEKGRVVPALASRWIVTDDDLSYIFRLQKTRWNDNKEISAEEVASALGNRIRELRDSDYGRATGLNKELALIDRVVSMTGKVVEIRLTEPMPNLLELLALPEFGFVRKAIGSGPMQARKYGKSMQLQLRTLDPKGNVQLLDQWVNLKSHRAAMALARFKSGETDLISAGHFQDLPYLEAAKIDGGIVQFDPTPGLFGLLIVEAGPFLSDTANREAIAMAIDRPKMLSAFEILAWAETVTLMPETMRNRAPLARPVWASLRMEQRSDNARATISRWTGANGKIRPLRIAMPQGPGARILFARLRNSLLNVGLNAERVAYNQPHDLRLIDRVAAMSNPAWYLAQISCSATRVCDKEADALVDQARAAKDKAERTRLLGEAEAKLQAKRNFIPIANPLRWSVTRKGLLGFAPSPRGFHPLQYLGREPT